MCAAPARGCLLPLCALIVGLAGGCHPEREYSLEPGLWSRVITAVEHRPDTCEELGLGCYEVGDDPGARVYGAFAETDVELPLPYGHVTEFVARGELDETVHLDTGDTVLPAVYAFQFSVSDDQKRAMVEERVHIPGLGCDPDDPAASVCAFTLQEAWTWDRAFDPLVD